MITVAYIAVTNGAVTQDYCARFVGSWLSYPPGIDTRLVVVCNGGPLDSETASLFLPLAPEFLPRRNDLGWDISGYQDAARKWPGEFMVCFGESVYFHRRDWLRRLWYARERFGPGMYGCYASYLVRPHLNTTAFSVDARFLQRSARVTDKLGRYGFEHGQEPFWSKVKRQGGATKLVTWDGFYDPMQWRSAENILWRGDQSNCLVWCNHTDRYFEVPATTQREWQKNADRLRDPRLLA